VERGVPADRVHVVPNGVDPTIFSPRQRDPELIRRYGLNDRTVIGYVSTLDHPREGHELLIEATSRLLRAGRHVTCLIVGDGRRRAELEELARRLGAGSAVIFAGAIPHDRVADYYALLDAFVVPRRDDRAARFVTPLKPFEAMAVGVPLVVADLPALMELAGRSERGLAFPVGDAEALATTIERLIDEPELGRRLAEAARRWVVSERTWASNGQRYRAIYESVTQEAARSTPT
jgi:glycosyltransferase involved in cell wall biosynthesis